MSAALLEIKGVSHAYGRHQALDAVDIRLDAGEVVAILGANGAGKTTLLNAVAGLIRPTSGAIRFAGSEVVGLPAHRIVELGVAAVPENRRLFDPMSVMENLTLGAMPSGHVPTLPRRSRASSNCFRGSRSGVPRRCAP
jgi:branched-chain amino acid transport system ATP-binding protein